MDKNRDEVRLSVFSKKAICNILILAMLICSFAPQFSSVSEAAKIRLSAKRVTIAPGNQVRIRLKGAKASRVKWISRNKKVAIVGKRGVIRAKKAGKAKIIARYRGKKYKCIVRVKNGATTTTSNSNSNSNNNSKATATPKATKSADDKYNSDDKNSTSGSSGVPSDEGSSSQIAPTSAAANSIQLGDISAGHTIAIGDSTDTIKKNLGTPVRIDTAVQGFKVYVFNPSGDYTNYLQVYVDSDVVIGMATVSSYFAFDSFVKSNDDSTTLSANGFSSDSSSSASRGYKKTIDVNGQSYNVIAYLDAIGGGASKSTSTNKVFGIQVYPSTYTNAQMYQNGSDYTTTCTASNGVYVNGGVNMECAELINSYRLYKGKKAYGIGTTVKEDSIAYAYYNWIISDFAQPAAEAMASKGTTSVESSSESLTRFDNGLQVAAFSWKEVYTSKSADPYDNLKTLIYDSTDSSDQATGILSDSYTAILCGFAYGSATYFVMDIWGP